MQILMIPLLKNDYLFVVQLLSPCRWTLEYAVCISCKGVRKKKCSMILKGSTKKECRVYDSKTQF